MLTQQFGWGIEPDYLAIFKPSSYHWLLPALEDPTQMSQMAMTFGGFLLSGFLLSNFYRVRAVKPTVLCASHFISPPSFSISSPSLASPACIWKACCVTNFASIRLSYWRFCIICTIFPSARGWDEQAR